MGTEEPEGLRDLEAPHDRGWLLCSPAIANVFGSGLPISTILDGLWY